MTAMMGILFRGKDLYTREWAFGNYCKAELLDGSGYEHFIIEVGKNGRTSKVDPYTVGQYIGLRDKHGKAAYDGDITEDDRGRRWVIFRAPGGFGTCRTAEYSKGYQLQFYEELGGLQNNSHFMQCHRIVGNVTDNPEELRRDTCKVRSKDNS